MHGLFPTPLWSFQAAHLCGQNLPIQDLPRRMLSPHHRNMQCSWQSACSHHASYRQEQWMRYALKRRICTHLIEKSSRSCPSFQSSPLFRIFPHMTRRLPLHIQNLFPPPAQKQAEGTTVIHQLHSGVKAMSSLFPSALRNVFCNFPLHAPPQ